MSKLFVLLLIVLVYFIVIVGFKKSEGMCSVRDDLEDSNPNIDVYYGEFGSVRVRTMTNGDKIIVGVTKNSNYRYDGGKVTLYSPDNETIVIYRSEDGEYLIADINSLDNIQDYNSKSVVTYYGDEGSVTIKKKSNGKIVILNHSLKSYEVTIDTQIVLYGPNGNMIKVIVKPSGEVILVDDDDVDKVTKRFHKRDPLYPRSKDFIRKTEIVPPICPVCPSITSCERVNKSSKDDDDVDSSGKFSRTPTVEEDSSGKFSRLPIDISVNNKGTTTVKGPLGRSISKTSDGTVVAQGTNGRTVVKNDNITVAQGANGGTVVKNDNVTVAQGPNGGSFLQTDNVTMGQGPQGTQILETTSGTTVLRDENGVNVMRDSYGRMTVRGPEGNYITNSKVGMYLGNNNLVNTPMPILNDFSTFAR